MNVDIAKLISGDSFGYNITLPQSQGGKVLSGSWDNLNDVKPFDPNAKPGAVGGNCLNKKEYLKLVADAKYAMHACF